MRMILVAAGALIAAPALAQTPVIAPQAINVTGHAKVSVPPDTANIHYWLRGEGKTPDEATRAMVDAQTRVETGLRGYLGSGADISNSNLVVIEVRDPDCKSTPGVAILSDGQCAIVGYLATSETDVKTSNIGKAGTAVGLASRLGARDARLLSFDLRDMARAQSEAMIRAVNDARAQAQVLSAAAGEHLGRVLSIQYGSYMAMPFARGLPAVAAPPPPPPPPPPVQIDMKPQPQDVSADVNVSYELLP